ncbi:N-acetyltransferase [Olsenella sp. SW781]|uniref:GNAT family N-acetyltransferase n=1 Tax=Olsenella sp. SW781 TaxID=2530046 RepID=UPI00143B8CF1|nr:GNAT family protein [Olsenella sp. SW781]NJE81115.1 N-acetyltransferase [Olsenella sp. SW781]
MLELRELERGDVPEVNRWRRDPELIACLGAPYRFIGPEIDERWFEGYLGSRSNTVRCAIVEHEEPSRILGLVTLAGIDWVNRSCTMHIMIGAEENRGRGLGTFAVDAILSHAFLDLNLRRVELSVLSSNERARRLYRRAGFTEEGVRREAVLKGGRYEDMVTMAVLRKDWGRLADSSL